MLNVAQITSELARLPDNALQRYAMMHKDDPYVLSLALSESNRRKEMRAGAQGQAAPQPSVADQAVAGMAPAPAPQQAQPMLPEQIGIGALPAQNIQRMAGGGITGYADGGEAQGLGPAGMLAYENEPVLRMADGGMVAFAEGDLVRGESGDYYAAPVTAEDLKDNDPLRALKRFVEFAGRNVERDPVTGDVVTKTPAPSFERKPATASQFGDYGPNMYAGLPAVAPAAAISAVKPPVARLPVASSGAAPTPAAPAAAPAMDPVAQAMALRKAIYGDEQPIETREQILAAQQKFAGESPYAAQLQRIQEQAKAARADKDEARGIALLKAGLGMMSSRSPYAMVGIGEGAKAGVEDYQAAMKDIRSAERDREKMRMELERGQYAEKLGQWDKAQGHYEKARELKAKVDENTMSAASSMAVAKQQIEGQKEVANIRGGYDIRQAQISAAAHDPLALYRVLGGGDVSKGYAVAKQDPLRATLTENWAKQAYPVTGMPNEGFIKRYPTPETYIQEALTLQGGTGGGGAGSAGAPLVRSR